MLTLRRAFKNIWRRRFRTVLVSLVLALCVAVFVSTIAGVDASEEATAEMLEQYEEIAESTIEQTELSMTAITVQNMRGFMPQSESSDGMSEDVADDISDMDDVAAVVPQVSGGLGEAEEAEGGGGPFGGGRVMSAYRVIGVPLDLDETYSVLPVNIVEGRSLEEDEDYAVLIGEDLTDYFDAGVGDTIKIEGTYFDVVGVYSSGFMRNEVYMSLSSAQEVLDMDGEISSLTVYADSADDVDSVVVEIEETYSDYMVMAMSDMQSQFGGRIQQQQEGIISTIDDNLSSIESTGLGITVVSVIIGVLLIFGLMFYTVRERTKEIGTLKALGFSNRDVLKQFMYEGFYVGLIGGALGLGIAAVSASLFSSLLLNTGDTMGTPVSVTVTMQVMLLGLGLAAVAGALGSLYPAWRASHVSPMEALRNE
ncbi:MAG TPA: FtsX-like permease family protein [Dehalococcoidia bacterium]|nr:FtsX-like permease family protein [Dehalococcoidia bacterium]